MKDDIRSTDVNYFKLVKDRFGSCFFLLYNLKVQRWIKYLRPKKGARYIKNISMGGSVCLNKSDNLISL